MPTFSPGMKQLSPLCNYRLWAPPPYQPFEIAGLDTSEGLWVYFDSAFVPGAASAFGNRIFPAEFQMLSLTHTEALPASLRSDLPILWRSLRLRTREFSLVILHIKVAWYRFLATKTPGQPTVVSFSVRAGIDLRSC